jgi:hypothetical protein
MAALPEKHRSALDTLLQVAAEDRVDAIEEEFCCD